MSDLISRQAAIAAADRADYTGFVVEDVKTVTDEVVKELKLLPSVQPERTCDTCRYNGLEWDEEPCDSCTMGGESCRWKPSAQPEIIRCKDCTRFDKKRGCNLVEGLNIAKTDSFCSYGERREDE